MEGPGPALLINEVAAGPFWPQANPDSVLGTFMGFALKVLEPYATKAARTVLRGRKLPGAVIIFHLIPNGYLFIL